ncbi:MAG TPA: phenylalanine--tRNA ligase subunit beta [Vicinamibacterales bacterium]|nr:phenylalanine--tRNA ligase subunit beta [Vicinamibacterales bacterium]
MKVLLSWIRDFVDVPGTAEEIGARMSLRGLALEGIERVGDDAVLDFDVTANRPDCLSIRGVAREIATAYGLALSDKAGGPGKAGGAGGSGQEALTVRIDEPELCARYVAAIADVTVGPSPDWMQTRLHACGVRPINNIVDITNYVLLELGQPMHAFDRSRLRGDAIVVRRARAAEKLTTLDGKARTLDAEMLVIADAERAAAIGGVMGGAESEVSSQTRQIVFESAWFKPQSVRATSKRLGLRSEASYRFERGADLAGCAAAMDRALELLSSIGAGHARGPVLDVHPAPYQPRQITLAAEAANRLLGMTVPAEDADRILRSLGFRVRQLGAWQATAPDASLSIGSEGAGWQVEVPGWRVDVVRPVDVIEEVGRHYGFEHLPATFPGVEHAPPPSDPRIARDARVRRALLGMGLSEAITFAFIDTAAAAPYLGEQAPVMLANPLSEKFTTLRPSLLAGLVDAVSHNRRHGRRDVRLFEIGTRFSPAGEVRAAACVWTGLASADHWSGHRRDVDFFDVKGAAEQLCALMKADAQFAASTRPYLVPGRAADVAVNGANVGIIGQLDPAVAAQREVPTTDAIYVLEFNLDALTAQAPSGVRFATPLARHPSVVRDVSILVDDTLSAESVREKIRAASVTTRDVPLVDVREFDRYQGKGIADGKASLSLRLTFQAPDRTLTDNEIHAAMNTIVTALTTDLGAIQR